jgi:polyferredoxin
MSRPSKTQPLAVKLARHLAMGALLGTVLAVSLVAMNVRNVLGLISLSASPWVTGMVFVSAIALFCAVGATLTGLIFILADDDNG